MKKTLILMILLSAVFAACENGDWEFDDYEYQTVYFAHQTPVRTVTLGEDIVDTSLDNNWKFKVLATTAGVYNNERDVRIGISVSSELLNGVTFDGNGRNVLPLPSDYYTMSSDEIIIEEGNLTGGVEIQLTQAFFDDPLALDNNYVLPLVMNDVTNADSILRGESLFDGANRLVSEHWAVESKDYTLYAVKYINPWHGFYLRRGTDQVVRDGVASTFVRHEEYIEYDEVYELTSRSLNEIRYPLVYKNRLEQDLYLEMELVFDTDLGVTAGAITDEYQMNDSVRVYDFTSSGIGRYVVDGEEKGWGDQDRDVLYLEYEVNFVSEITFPISNPGFVDTEVVSYSTTDTLVMRNRGVAYEEFAVVVQ